MSTEVAGGIIMGAPVAWFEINSPEPARLIGFYRDLFGWGITDGPGGGYSLIETGSGDQAIGGGIGATQGPDDPGGVTVYLRVGDLQASLERAETLGGRTLEPPTDLPGGYGRFAMFADPDGHPLGLWT